MGRSWCRTARRSPRRSESELFGHKRGSFTGAIEDKKGLFELADGGTVFLDEIGETSPALQARLLRVLQEGEVKAVGATAIKRVDVRVVSATNRDLAAEVAAGRFREDLFYRLNLFTLTVPPLRERTGDIPVLVHHFVERVARKLGVPAPALRKDALETLIAHGWPGNVRELENEIERAVTLVSEGEPIGVELFSERVRGAARALPPSTVAPSPAAPLPAAPAGEGGTLNDRVDELKRVLIERALLVHGNKSTAAEALGLTRQSLQKMMRRLGMR
ncbi:MAG: sigma 54-interacting transcriptional regulator [Deltaproteobacteria bacterium]|nr:sigma 54-interacting transcriptional regulator [Deltaproteobacteria bacterium]